MEKEVDRSSIISSTQGGVVQPDSAEEPRDLPGYTYKRFAKPYQNPSFFFFFLTSKLWIQSDVASVYGSVELDTGRSMLLSTPPLLWGVTEALGLR